MNESNERPSLDVTLVAISRAEASVLASLFELYAHDFSEVVPLRLGANGRFELPIEERWWSSAAHFPYFILQAGTLAGFALVRRGSRITAEAEVMDVAEFFVVRGARRRGVGRAAARALFSGFPGPWELRVRHGYAAARDFWRRAAAPWLAPGDAFRACTADGVAWEVLRLDSAPRAASLGKRA